MLEYFYRSMSINQQYDKRVLTSQKSARLRQRESKTIRIMKEHR